MAETVSNISSCVTSSLNQMKKFGLGEKDRPWLTNIAIRFYSDKLSGFLMPSIKSVIFPVTAAVRHWPLPLDYMMYTKIAYKCYNGTPAYVLGLNEDMDISSPPGLCSDPIECCNTPLNGGFFFADGWQGYGNYNQALFATGGGFAANYYRVDYQRSCIRFTDELPVGNAYIEYVSNGGKVNESTMVLVAYRGSFEDYLKWQICALDPSLKRYEEGFRRDFKIQMWDTIYLVEGLNTQQVRDEINKSCGFNLNR